MKFTCISSGSIGKHTFCNLEATEGSETTKIGISTHGMESPAWLPSKGQAVKLEVSPWIEEKGGEA